jgi:hypothetical protein
MNRWSEEMSHEKPTAEALEIAVVDATRHAALALFREFQSETFYYFALVTTGEAHAPVVTAWSLEALAASSAKHLSDPSAASELKWSSADSPYYGYGEGCFEEVGRLFAEFEPMDPSDPSAWSWAYTKKMDAMERALAKLDREGLFGTGVLRNRIVVNVECMPPDQSNRERALRLNPKEALIDWLVEAAEPE